MRSQCDGRRIAKIVDRVTGETEELFCFCRSHDHRRYYGRLSLKHFYSTFIRLLVVPTRRPDVGSAVLATTYHVFPVVAKGGTDLAGVVLVSAEFCLQSPVLEVVESNSGVIARNKKLYLSIRVVGRLDNRIDACNLASLGIAPTR